MKMKQTGSVFQHAGLWYYSVKLPGAKCRRQVPLKAAGSDHTLSADRPREMAEKAAARYWEAETRQFRKGDRAAVTADDVAAAYCRHAEVYYRRADGTATSEVATIRIALRLFRKMFGRAAIAELTHGDLVRWRDAAERSGICRKSVNRHIGILRRMMVWALDDGLISATVKAELTQLSTLKRGRCLAHDCEPVRPVDDATVEKTLTVMMPNTADMVRVHALTGMRPDEICAMRWADIDRSALPWVYRPQHHKNEWRGMPRVVCIGAKAREVLSRHDGGDPLKPIFSPKVAMVEWFAAKRAAAVSPSHQDRRDPSNPRVLGDGWRPDTYGRTVREASARAGVEHWSPNRLRHSFATKVRRAFGLEATRAVLGHSNGGCVTDIYSREALEEEVIAKAAPAVEALG